MTATLYYSGQPFDLTAADITNLTNAVQRCLNAGNAGIAALPLSAATVVISPGVPIAWTTS
jgi:hypothetical protein